MFSLLTQDPQQAVAARLLRAARLLALAPLLTFAAQTPVATASPSARGAASPRHLVQTIPIVFRFTPQSLDGGSGSITVTVEVDQIPAGGSSVQVSTDHPGLLTSPSGSWPYHHTFAEGSSVSQTFTVGTSSVSQNMSIQLYTCEEGVDITNSANWRIVKTLNLICNPD